VLFPPLPNPELYSKGEAEDYFIYSARIAVIKRQALAIEAMQYVKSDFKLLLVGKGDMESYMLEMQQLAQKLNVHHKVRFAGWVSEEEKASLTANAIAALYIAFDEDSYGYSTLEAFHSHKAVVTCTDSGGTHDVIEDGVNGRIVEPTPQALAAAMEELWANKQRTAQMGENAFATIERYGITWDRVVEELAG
jgi:glycosyltransferase involved in cell wall biosynthesis